MWGVLSADTLSAAARKKTRVNADFMFRKYLVRALVGDSCEWLCPGALLPQHSLLYTSEPGTRRDTLRLCGSLARVNCTTH